MVTTEEIERRIKEVDSARSARRTVAAKRVGELARQRNVVAEQLNELERELGDALAESRDVIGIDELARFTDVPSADLARWLERQKASRAKRRRPATRVGATRKDATQATPAATVQEARQTSPASKP